MKKIYIAFLISVLSLALSSCERSVLEPWPPDAARQAEDIWGNYYYTKGVLDRAYTGEGTCAHWSDVYGATINGALSMSPLACATDEAEHTVATANVQRFTNGNWNTTNTPTTYYGSRYNGHNARSPWINAYLGMRRLHLFLDNVEHSVLIDDPDDPTRAHDRTYWRGQAFFLRAFFSFEILKRYGGYPISLHVEEISEDLYRPRNTMEECVAQICADLDSAAAMLPALWDEENWHRANRMFAQALKSRVLLYYASPLYQGDFWTFGLNKGEVGDVQRWIDAVDASREAINNNDFYNLMEVTNFNRPYSNEGTYGYQIGLTGNLENVEQIHTNGFYSGSSSGGTYFSVYDERYNLPDGLDGCYGYCNPTQEMVDAFEVVTGTGSNRKAVPFDWNNEAHAKNPYANRDNRFYNSIIYNGMIWGESSSKATTIYTYEPVTIGTVSYPAGKHRDRSRLNATKTGYYYRKYFSEAVYSLKSGNYTRPSRSHFDTRFAELVLNYAEALNEAYGPDAPDPKGELREILGVEGINTARQAVNIIRSRVNMPAVDREKTSTQEGMREAIHHERRIELCFEGQRFYDLRRWKEAEEVLGKPIHGIKITPTKFNNQGVPTEYNYEVEKVEDRVWMQKYYWYPIPYAELVKYAGKGPDGTNPIKQNPGWD